VGLWFATRRRQLHRQPGTDIMRHDHIFAP
jgi:hypothetical protein